MYNRLQYLFKYCVTDTFAALMHKLQQSTTLVKSCSQKPAVTKVYTRTHPTCANIQIDI